jgi:hypothetical protein
MKLFLNDFHDRQTRIQWIDEIGILIKEEYAHAYVNFISESF